MKTFTQLRQYLPEFFLERKIFQITVVEIIKTRFMFSNFFFFKQTAVCEIMSKNIVEPEGPQITIWRRAACWISNATLLQAHTHTHKYVILIAFPRQPHFPKRASVLRYTLHVYCMSCIPRFQVLLNILIFWGSQIISPTCRKGIAKRQTVISQKT